MTHKFRSSDGQIAILFALAIAGLLGGMALCTDVSVMYLNWQRMQKAVDSAALAGATYLPEDSVNAILTAQTYGADNGLRSSEMPIPTVSIGASSSTITVSASRQVPYYFGRVLGLTSQLISVTATAAAPSAVSTVGCLNTTGAVCAPGAYGTSTGDYPLIPIGLDYSTPYSYDQPVQLNYGSVGAGNWGSLAMGGVGGSNLRSNIADGYSGPVSIGDWITTEPGKKVGPVDQGFGDRISASKSANPNASFSDHTANDPRAVVLPLVDWSTAQGRSSVVCKGFVMVWLDSVSGGTIQAHFIQQVVPNSLPNSQAADNGALGVPRLIH
ncbi:MAG TPA: pilus assembly protein TadG-related protein [Candidatus Binataceae bacterium]|nr:pilus assembly protein TadG-related protein [Candidatus Binataceae bacterium]